jgi:hypothetical protein
MVVFEWHLISRSANCLRKSSGGKIFIPVMTSINLHRSLSDRDVSGGNLLYLKDPSVEGAETETRRFLPVAQRTHTEMG